MFSIIKIISIAAIWFKKVTSLPKLIFETICPVSMPAALFFTFPKNHHEMGSIINTNKCTNCTNAGR